MCTSLVFRQETISIKTLPNIHIRGKKLPNIYTYVAKTLPVDRDPGVEVVQCGKSGLALSSDCENIFAPTLGLAAHILHQVSTLEVKLFYTDILGEMKL